MSFLMLRRKFVFPQETPASSGYFILSVAENTKVMLHVVNRNVYIITAKITKEIQKKWQEVGNNRFDVRGRKTQEHQKWNKI